MHAHSWYHTCIESGCWPASALQLAVPALEGSAAQVGVPAESPPGATMGNILLVPATSTLATAVAHLIQQLLQKECNTGFHRGGKAPAKVVRRVFRTSGTLCGHGQGTSLARSGS